MLEKFFKLSENHTDAKTEILAGITTFMTMAYILAVNPSIMAATGMDSGAVFTATALAAFIGTLLMAIFANYPFALAPGMGLNAYFAYTVVIGMGYTWQYALTAVFAEGIIFILLSLTNVREAIFNAIPMNLKSAVSVGIGLFIAFVGLQNAHIVVGGSTLLQLFSVDAYNKANGVEASFNNVGITVILALAEIKSSSAGIQLGMLFIDEPPFLDGDGIQAYCDALETIQSRYSNIKIMAITHDPTMKARFPQNLDVVKTENGSKVIY